MKMSDDQVRITIICDRQRKREIKSAIMDMEIDNFQDGYNRLMEIGLKHYKEETIES
jgi:hypothetical protein